ncbi:unnamed protein product [Sphagnum troendelagicum]
MGRGRLENGSSMRQAAAAADANRSAPRKWLKPNRQEGRQMSVVWMSLLQSKNAGGSSQRHERTLSAVTELQCV